MPGTGNLLVHALICAMVYPPMWTSSPSVTPGGKYSAVCAITAAGKSATRSAEGLVGAIGKSICHAVC